MTPLLKGSIKVEIKEGQASHVVSIACVFTMQGNQGSNDSSFELR